MLHTERLRHMAFVAVLATGLALPGAALAQQTGDGGGTDQFAGNLGPDFIFTGAITQTNGGGAVPLRRTNDGGGNNDITASPAGVVVGMEYFPKRFGNGGELTWTNDNFASSQTIGMSFAGPGPSNPANNDLFIATIPAAAFVAGSRVQYFLRGFGPLSNGDNWQTFVPGGGVNFFFDAVALTCPANCDSCSNATSCDVCADGFFPDGAGCSPCLPTCATCDALNDCTACIADHSVVGGACVPDCSVPGCLSCDAPNNCDSCDAGWTLDAGACVPDCNLLGCVSCDAPDNCDSCAPGFRLNGGACEPGADHSGDAGGSDEFAAELNGEFTFVGNFGVQVSGGAVLPERITNDGGGTNPITNPEADLEVFIQIFPRRLGNGAVLSWSNDAGATQQLVPMPFLGQNGNNDEFRGVIPAAALQNGQRLLFDIRAFGPRSNGSEDWQIIVPGGGVNFFFDPQPICRPNCRECPLVDCRVCEDGFFEEFGDCKPCPQNCTSCTFANNCTQCDAGFVSDGSGGCEVECNVDGCLSCDTANNCDSCDAGWTLDAGSCVPDCDVLGCSSCKAPNDCDVCGPGFRLNAGACDEGADFDLDAGGTDTLVESPGGEGIFGGTVFIGEVGGAAVAKRLSNDGGGPNPYPNAGVDLEVFVEIFPRRAGNGASLTWTNDGGSSTQLVPMPFHAAGGPGNNNDVFRGVIPAAALVNGKTLAFDIDVFGAISDGRDWRGTIPGSGARFIVDPQPLSCPANCTVCPTGACEACEAGFELDGSGGCAPECNVANCDSCNITDVCAQCSAGYELDGGGCTPRCEIDGCVSCNSPNACSDCGIGHRPSSDAGSCQRGAAHRGDGGGNPSFAGDIGGEFVFVGDIACSEGGANVDCARVTGDGGGANPFSSSGGDLEVRIQLFPQRLGNGATLRWSVGGGPSTEVAMTFDGQVGNNDVFLAAIPGAALETSGQLRFDIYAFGPQSDFSSDWSLDLPGGGERFFLDLQADCPANCADCDAPNNCLVCDAGYAVNAGACEDIDECAAGTHDCDIFAECANTVGGFTCTCDPTLEGDGRTCSVPVPATQGSGRIALVLGFLLAGVVLARRRRRQ